MQIKLADGTTQNVAGTGVANTGLGLGIAGTALGLLNGNGNGLLGGLFGGNRNMGGSDNEPITRYEANLLIAMQGKDSEIASLKSDQYTDRKLVEVYNAVATKANENRDRIDALSHDFIEKITAEREARLIAQGEQQVFNQTMIGSTSTINAQIQQLQGVVANITTNVVPANKVCNTGCCACNQ